MIAGSMVALVTPMDAQGRLDWDSLDKLVDFHGKGTHAIVAVGTTGESATLDVEEHIPSSSMWSNASSAATTVSQSLPVPAPTPLPKPST